MQSISDKVYSFILSHKRGWVFTSADITNRFVADDANKSLSMLHKEGKIRRLARGLYDYPKYSEFLEKELSPEFDKAAEAFARKFNWRIIPTGDTALNILGISTQVPGRYVYYSDGPTKKYSIGDFYDIEFKKKSLKETGFKHKESGIIVQAIKSIGKGKVTKSDLKAMQKFIGDDKCRKILNDTSSTTLWIYEYIKDICRADNV